jgi:membrane protease YdiL (CAAX protease family)
MNNILKKLILNFAASAVVCALSGFGMLATRFDERFLKDGIAVTFFTIFALLYFATTYRSSADNLPKLGGLSMKSYCIFFAQSIFAFSMVVLCVSVTSGPAFIPTTYDWTCLPPIFFLLVSSIYEEIVFRGYILYLFRKFFRSKIPPIILMALLFSLIHPPGKYGASEFLWHFIFGILTGILTLKYNSLSPSIIIHFTFNYGVGSSQLEYEVAKLHPGIVNFHSHTPSENFLLFSSIVFLCSAIFFHFSKNEPGRKYSIQD